MKFGLHSFSFLCDFHDTILSSEAFLNGQIKWSVE